MLHWNVRARINNNLTSLAQNVTQKSTYEKHDVEWKIHSIDEQVQIYMLNVISMAIAILEFHA